MTDRPGDDGGRDADESGRGPVAADGDGSEGTVAGTDPDVAAGTEDGPVPGRLAGTPGRWRSLAWRMGIADWTLQVVVGLAVLAVLARLVLLGARPMHFDEGRVAYWAVHAGDTGYFRYRPIIHGPLLQHVDRWLFALVGPSDFAARLPVAVVGGLFPLAALLFRDHLRDSEVVAMAGLLAVNPVLLYYSRFMRSDLLVAAFALVALGALLRLASTRRVRYAYAAALALALAFASKENAVVYLLCWLGAAALVVDVELYRPREHDDGAALLADVRGRLSRAARGERAPRYLLHAVGAALLFAVVSLFLFAPRAGPTDDVGLWMALADPTQLPALVDTTVRDVTNGFGYWFGKDSDPPCYGREAALQFLLARGLPEGSFLTEYLCVVGKLLSTLGSFAAATVGFAAAGFLAERYAVERSRALVMFATYWAGASVVGYPVGTDIWAAWVVVHVVVPLSIPAAVGVGYLLRQAGKALESDDAAAVGLTVLVLVATVGWSGAVGVDAAFLDPHTRDGPADMVQYAQPDGDLKPALAAMEEAVEDHDGGPDVLYYGDRYYLANESAIDEVPYRNRSAGIDTGPWYKRLPLPWYTRTMGAETASASNVTQLEPALAEQPPVVVAQKPVAGQVDERLDGYRTYEFDMRANIGSPGRTTSVVVFVDESRL